MKALLIINPISGTLPKDDLEARVREKLEPSGYDITTVTTEYAGHGAELARHAVEEGYDVVLAAGGDGTVNEIASTLRDTPVALGILPFGSGNGLARHLGVSIDVDHALDIITKKNVQPCDYGTVNDLPFFCTFGLGFDAKVSKEFALMPTRGLATYVKSALQEYMSYSPMEYEIFAGGECMRVKAFLVAVCNASQYGNNAFIAPSASIRDGFLDIVIIHSGNPITRAIAGVELFTGRLEHNVLIQTLRVRKATIRHLPGPAHLDGEPRMMPQTLEVECHHGKINMLIDPDKPPFKPFVTPMESLRDDSAFLIKEGTRNALKNLKKIFPLLGGFLSLFN